MHSECEDVMVSVIMCAYNSEAFISETIDSILEQTYQNLELIIVDDGSTDMTEKIILSYNDKRINYIKNQANKGIFWSANIGLKNSRGKYIARIDSDDIAHKMRLEEQVSFMEKNPEIGLCGTESITFSSDKKHNKSILPHSHDEIRAYFMFSNCVVHPTIMVRKSVLEAHGVEYNSKYVAGGDFAFYMSLINKTQFANIPKPLLYYRLHNQNITKLKKQEQSTTSSSERVVYLKLLLGNIEAKEEFLDKHLSIISKKIHTIKDLKELIDWMLYIKQINKVENLFDEKALLFSCSLFLYRRVLHTKLQTVGLLHLLLTKYSMFFKPLPWQYKSMLVIKSLKSSL